MPTLAAPADQKQQPIGGCSAHSDNNGTHGYVNDAIERSTQAAAPVVDSMRHFVGAALNNTDRHNSTSRYGGSNRTPKTTRHRPGVSDGRCSEPSTLTCMDSRSTVRALRSATAFKVDEVAVGVPRASLPSQHS